MTGPSFCYTRLYERIIVFLHDVKTFNESVLLENYVDSSYMSTTHFLQHEIDELKSIEVDGKTLASSLDDLFKSKREFLCSSHDLYPLYAKYFHKYFNINLKNVSNQKVKKHRRVMYRYLEIQRDAESVSLLPSPFPPPTEV